MAPHEHQFTVASGHHEAEAGKRGAPPFLNLQPVGVDMPFQVVYPQKGKVAGQRYGLGHVEPHQQGAGEARADGYRHPVQVLPIKAGSGHGPLQDRNNAEQVLAGGHLWDNAAIPGMKLHLGGHHIGENTSLLLHHSSRRLITGGLNAQNFHNPMIIAWARWKRALLTRKKGDAMISPKL
jgi:hypothetical protein